MHKIFVEYGAKLPKPDVPYQDTLQLVLEYYLDGYEVTVIDNYEGPPRFEVEADREKDVRALMAHMISNGHVFAAHQIARVSTASVRMMAPVSRYSTVIKAPSVQVGVDPGHPDGDAEVLVASVGDDIGSQSEQGDGVREADPQLPYGEVGDEGGESGSIGL